MPAVKRRRPAKRKAAPRKKSGARKATSKKPRVGQVVSVRGKRCRIFKVHPAGTIDVESLDGKSAFRISGLPL